MRGKSAPKRTLAPDPKYQSTRVAKFINHIMRCGKKTVAQKIVYDSFEIIQQKTKKDPLTIFDAAVRNVSPDVEIKSRRIGGGNYQIPVVVTGDRKYTLAYRWIIQAAKERKGMPMREKLAEEIIDAANNTGAAIKKKNDVFRMAEANRAFAHLARFRR